MPTKQTRESIEAELNASDVERAVAKLREITREAELSAVDQLQDILDARRR